MEPIIKKTKWSNRCLNLCGRRFGKLEVVRYVGIDNRNRAIWECVCDCGNMATTATYSLTSGETKSCGCLNRTLAAERMRSMTIKHGMECLPEYSVWKGMKKRCYQKKHKDYGLYGGRGIVVCDEWLHDFSVFYNDMGQRPKGMTIDRIDSDGNYSKENCRWATRSRQARNQRRIRKIHYNGKSLCAADWSDITGQKASTITARKLRGWTDEESIIGKKL